MSILERDASLARPCSLYVFFQEASDCGHELLELLTPDVMSRSYNPHPLERLPAQEGYSGAKVKGDAFRNT